MVLDENRPAAPPSSPWFSSVRDENPSSPADPSHVTKHDADSAFDDDTQSTESQQPRTRFLGKDDAWRIYTQKERDVVRALDRSWAGDLSLHLYNVHALKLQARQNFEDQAERSNRGKHRWLRVDNVGASPWIPDRQWTAWPLSPDLVPNQDEGFGKVNRWGSSSLRRGDESIGQRMNEELQAIMLNRAKRQLWANERKRKKRSRLGSSRSEAVDHAVTAPSISETVGKVGETSAVDMNPTAGKKLKKAVSFDKKALGSDDHDGEDDEDDLDDGDEEAHQIMQPISHHILSRLDDLLLVLSKSRHGHVRSRSKDGTFSRASSRKNSIVGTEPIDCDMDVKVDDHLENVHRDHTPDSPTPASTGDTLFGRHVTRDWSEVLGAAAVSGWSPLALERATARCSALFQENMAFRVMPETRTNSSQRSKGSSLLSMQQAVKSEFVGGVVNSSKPQDVAIHRSETMPYFCPVFDCARSVESFEQAWRWREHLKRKHDFSTTVVAEYERRLFKQSAPAHSAFDEKICPVAACARRDTPFDSAWRLREHLKRVHKLDRHQIAELERAEQD